MNRTEGRISSSCNTHKRGDPGTILVVGTAGGARSDLAAVLSDGGYHVVQAGSAVECARPPASDVVPLALVVVAPIENDPGGTREAMEAARVLSRRYATRLLHVVPEPADCEALLGHLTDSEDWVSAGASAAELRCRVQGLIQRRSDAVAEEPVWIPGADFLSMLVHDLRSPLNVIWLSMQMLPPSIADADPELENDLRMMRENFEHLARKLTLLEDFHRLLQPQGEEGGFGFSPSVLIEEVVQEVLQATHPVPFSVAVEFGSGSPAVVGLDAYRCRLGLHYALMNAGRAAELGKVRLVSRGDGDRWVVEIVVDSPPPGTVQPGPLLGDGFERIVGAARERRGMDLSIVARVSESFGGRARLETVPGRSTSLVLDWPAELRSPLVEAK
ncbi:MAG: HAMP domain-containing sensor histidine kinase [Isosphaeraceae bacterium]